MRETARSSAVSKFGADAGVRAYEDYYLKVCANGGNNAG
jgi:hypothetical protein